MPYIQACLEAGQGLGNQLWRYVSTRAISEELGFGFYLKNSNIFKANDFLDIDNFINDPLDTETSIDDISWDYLHEELYYDYKTDYVSSDYDKRFKCLRNSTIVDGLFQSEKYFSSDFSKLSRYIRLSASPMDDELRNLISSKTCILNIRGGEYKRHKKFILPKSYWENTIRIMKDLHGIDDFVVVTDDLQYAKYLFKSLPCISNSVERCYRAIALARFVITANTTFSYFPIMCSSFLDEKHILAPAYWSRFNMYPAIWSSPANYYSHWNWINLHGDVMTRDECEHHVEKARFYLQKELPVKCRMSDLPNKTKFRYLSGPQKAIIKRLLSIPFPQHFG